MMVNLLQQLMHYGSLGGKVLASDADTNPENSS